MSSLFLQFVLDAVVALSHFDPVNKKDMHMK